MKPFGSYFSCPSVFVQTSLKLRSVSGLFKLSLAYFLGQSEPKILRLVVNAIILSIQILTKDAVTVSVDAVVYFNVTDSILALCSVSDFR